MRNQRVVLASLVLELALAPAAVAQAAKHYEQRMAKFAAENAALDPAKRHVVLVGDSLTELWERGDRIARYLPALAGRVLDLATKKPATRKALLDVYGLGEAKVAQFGDQILQALSGL